MAKRDRTAEAWEAIAALRTEPNAARLAEELRSHLANKAGVIIAKAAALALDRQSDLEPHIDLLAPALTAAFDRCITDPVRTDPGCGGKIAIVNAGVAFHCLDSELYLRAIRHVQLEGSYGPPVDTAEALRAGAAYGLLNCRHADAMYEIVQLLGEAGDGRVPDSRRGAIRALGTVVSETSAALLRMTALNYYNDPDTLCEVFASLNSIEAGRSFDFIADFLDEPDPNVRDIAGLALAEGKQPRASGLLLAHVRRHVPENPHALFTALAITRKQDAIDFLIDRVGNAHEREALGALEALHLMRHDQAMRGRLEQVVRDRGVATLNMAMRKWSTQQPT